MSEQNTEHTFVVYVEDRPGVLNRVSSLFRRRNFNIISLNVGQTHEPGISRMTVVCRADRELAKRVEANLYKLVNVLRVDDITDEPSVVRNHVLLKIAAPPERHAEVVQICDMSGTRILGVGTQSIIIEITGAQDRIHTILQSLESFEILEMVQTGSVAMTRGEAKRTIPADRPKSTFRAA